MTDKLKLDIKKLQEFYSQLITVANASMEDPYKVSDEFIIDRELSPTDIALSTNRNDLSCLFSFGPSTLRKIYSRAMECDADDGKFDGKIDSSKCSKTEIVIEMGDIVGPTKWNSIIEKNKNSVFELDVPDVNKKSTAWIIEKEIQKSGKARYYLITAAHGVDVCYEQENYFILKSGAKTYNANLVGVDHFYDLAVLSFESNDVFEPIKTSKDDVKQNEEICVLGNDQAKGVVPSIGTVKSPSKYLKSYPFKLIQDTSPSFRGNSGAPVFNLSGDVIAVCILGESTDNYNVPIDYIFNSYQQIKTKGFVSHGSLRISGSIMGKDELEFLSSLKSFIPIFATPYDYAMIVNYVEDGSLAKQAGLERGDVILTYDGFPIPPGEQISVMQDYISTRPIISVLKLLIFRNGNMTEISVPIEEEVENHNNIYKTPWGFHVREPNGNEIESLGFKNMGGGLIMESVFTGSNEKAMCYIKGVFSSIDDVEVKTLSELTSYMKNSNSPKFLIKYFTRNPFNVDSSLEIRVVNNPYFIQ